MTLQLVKPLRIKSYNGMIFSDYVDFPEVKHQFAINQNDKLVSKGPLTLQVHKQSYAYDPELLLSCWTVEFPQVVDRGVHDSHYWRTEQILAQIKDFEKIRKWKEAFEEAAFICQCILEGVI